MSRYVNRVIVCHLCMLRRLSTNKFDFRWIYLFDWTVALTTQVTLYHEGREDRLHRLYDSTLCEGLVDCSISRIRTGLSEFMIVTRLLVKRQL